MRYKGVGWKVFSASVVIVGAFMFMIGYYARGYDTTIKPVPTPPGYEVVCKKCHIAIHSKA